jgi:hypothetical protein
MSEGADAWRTRFINLYDHQCDIHESHKMISFMLDTGNSAGALDALKALVERHDREVEALCRRTTK